MRRRAKDAQSVTTRLFSKQRLPAKERNLWPFLIAAKSKHAACRDDFLHLMVFGATGIMRHNVAARCISPRSRRHWCKAQRGPIECL